MFIESRGYFTFALESYFRDNNYIFLLRPDVDKRFSYMYNDTPFILQVVKALMGFKFFFVEYASSETVETK